MYLDIECYYIVFFEEKFNLYIILRFDGKKGVVAICRWPRYVEDVVLITTSSSRHAHDRNKHWP